MKYFLIIIAIVILSCKEKYTNKMDSAIGATEVAQSILNQNHGVERASDVKVVMIYEKNLPDQIIEDSKGNKNSGNAVESGYLKSYLYKGTLDGKHKISLYLTAHENPCGGGMDAPSFKGMYTYNNQDQWILLHITTDVYRSKFCMVEDWFTGTLFLTKKEDKLTGKWISPNVDKQFNVELENQLLDKKLEFDKEVIKNLDRILFDNLLYRKNDC
jgi:hypothetical protein